MADATKTLEIVISAKDEATKTLQKFSGPLNDLQNNLKKTGIFFAGISAASTLAAKSFIDAAGEMQATRTAFKTLIGDADLAKKTLDELFSLEARTPFNLQNILSESKKLLAMGTDAKDLTKTLTMLGDVASGVGFEKLPQLTLAFGQIQAKGRLMGTELRQLTEAGFNLAEAMGVSSEKLDEMIANKEVGFERVRLAFEKVTGEGGRFHNLMADLALTTPGRLSTLESSIYKLKKALGDALLPEVNKLLDRLIPVVDELTRFVENNQLLVSTLTGIGLAMGILGTISLGTITIITGLSASFGFLFGSIRIVSMAITTLIGILGGPLTIAIVVILALVVLLSAAWINNWGGMKDKTKAVVDWFSNIAIPTFRDNFNVLTGYIKNAVNIWIDNFNKFKSDVDVIIGKLDALKNKAKELFSNERGGFKIPGFFQHGGFVPGSYGEAVPAILHGGERVVPRNGTDVNTGAGGGVTINISGSWQLDSEDRIDQLVDKIIRTLGRQNELASKGVGF